MCTHMIKMQKYVCQKGELRILQLSVSFLPCSLLFYRQMFSTCCVKKYVLPGLVRLRMLLCYVLTGEAMGTVTGTRHLTSPKWLMKQLNDHRYIGLTSDVLFFVLLFLIPLSFSLWHLNILIMISLLETACIIYVQHLPERLQPSLH